MRALNIGKVAAAPLALGLVVSPLGDILDAPAAVASAAVLPKASHTASAGTAACYPTGLGADISLVDPKVVLGTPGQYDQAACDARYRNVLAGNAKTSGKLPNVKRSTASFVGMDRAYFAMDNDVYGWNVSNTPRKLASTVANSCGPAGAWDAISAKAAAADPGYDPHKPPKFVVNQCTNATYINEFMYGSSGVFAGNQKKKLLRTVPSTVKVNGVETQVLTWTHGYLLLKYGNECADCGVPGTSQVRAVIDAGSSGTRLSLYRVKYKPNGYPKVTWKQTLKGTDNGIDDYVNPDISQRPGTGNVNTDVITPLLDAATTGYFAKHKPAPKSNIEVDLLATAGMREAQAKWGEAAVNTMYSSIRANVNMENASFNTELRAISPGSKYSAGKVRTINGNTQEGVWTWVNLNDYYCNYFKDPKGKKMKECRGVKGGYLGVVEVGGASTQVSFPVRAKSTKGHEFVHQVRLNGRHLRIYNKSFLGLGLDSARRIIVAQ